MLAWALDAPSADAPEVHRVELPRLALAFRAEGRPVRGGAEDETDPSDLQAYALDRGGGASSSLSTGSRSLGGRRLSEHTARRLSSSSSVAGSSSSKISLPTSLSGSSSASIT